MAAYGDSETESEDEEDEEDDEEDLDSVSIVAAKTAAETPVVPQNRIIGNATNATKGNDSDSGRGESPESYGAGRGGSGVQMRQQFESDATRGNAAGMRHKAPRPISAVPSEYSDISTSSCRSTTSEADEDEHHAQPTPPIQPQLVNVAEEEEESSESRMIKVHRIAQELLTTEELYVSVLHLIDQVRLENS
jgi:hypothetical protein